MSGLYTFQSIYYKNNGKPEQRRVSRHNKEFGINSSGHVFVDYRLISEDNYLYGTKISLEHTSVNNRSIPFLVYFESKFGRLEGGANSSAGKKMRITAYSTSCAAGNAWSSSVILSPHLLGKRSYKLVAYITNFCSFLDSKTRTSGKADYSRKISYFTPKLPIANAHTVQVGVSYIPDSSNMGHNNISKDNKNYPVPLVPYKFILKDGISYGIAYNGKFSSSLSGKISFVGETGKPLAFNQKNNKQVAVNFKNLNTYVLGGEIKYNDIRISVSYANYNQSLTTKSVDLISRDSYGYGFGAKYNFNKYSVSINQFNSSFKKSKLSATSLGMDYMVAKGFKTYIQSTFYQTNGKFIEDNTIKSHKSTGMLVLLGMKISF